MPSSQPRLYDALLAEHLAKNRQMAFVSGPRQVGKSTTCQHLADLQLNFDKAADRKVILEGEEAIKRALGNARPPGRLPVVLFDELHKLPKWKNYLKGIFDGNEGAFRILVTGSSKLDAFRKAGDSLMGRYFTYRMHPLTVGELARPEAPASAVIRQPKAIPPADFDALYAHGGFPEPYVRREAAFSEQWREKRYDQVTQEDVRDLSKTAAFSQMQSLALLLTERSAQQLTLLSLAKTLQISPHTVKAWMAVLSDLHWGFLLRPYHHSLARSLRKEPKWHLRDWSGIDDPGAKAETFVACHLLKAVETWTDLGLGHHDLAYIRDKDGREVDFLILRKRKPWMLVEVKKSKEGFSPSLEYFHKLLKTEHALQVVVDAPYDKADCVVPQRPVLASAKSFLSQLC